jgi:methyltransferase
MPASVAAFLVLLVLVGVMRVVELKISRRNQLRLAQRGAIKVPEPHFGATVALHTGVLISAGLEVLILHRPFIPALAIVSAAVFLLADVFRWWVIATLAEHWNVQIMDSGQIGVVTRGPYRWIRHPNYLAVVVELASLPMIHTAWITAIWGTLGYCWLLRSRIRVEEHALMANPAYRAAMGSKPRFLPGLF